MAEKKRGPGRPPGSKNKTKSTSRNTQKTSTKSSSSGQRTSASAARKVDEIEARNQAKAQIKDEIIGIIIIAVGVFLVVALQTAYAGSAGAAISSALKGCFGFTAFVLPYYFIVYGVLLFMGKTIHIGIKSIILLVIIFLMISLINAGRFMDPIVEGGGFHSVSQSFENGIALSDGGVFGMFVGSLLSGWIGVPGLYILTFVVIFICLLLLINTPVSRFFENMKARRIRRQLERTETVREETEKVENARQIRQQQLAEDNERRKNAGKREKIISLISDEEPSGRAGEIGSSAASGSDKGEQKGLLNFSQDHTSSCSFYLRTFCLNCPIIDCRVRLFKRRKQTMRRQRHPQRRKRHRPGRMFPRWSPVPMIRQRRS